MNLNETKGPGDWAGEITQGPEEKALRETADLPRELGETDERKDLPSELGPGQFESDPNRETKQNPEQTAVQDVPESVKAKVENDDLAKGTERGETDASDADRELPPHESDAQEVKPPIQNKTDGCRREKEVESDLKNQYPDAVILKEKYLCNRDGSHAVDPETGERRRVDFAVIKDGKVVDLVEVTSPTAEKDKQTAKEIRIREAGGNYIKRPDGKPIRIPNNVQTRIERRP